MYARPRALALRPALLRLPPGTLKSPCPGPGVCAAPCRQAPGPCPHQILLVLTSSSASLQIPACPCSPGFMSGLSSLPLALTVDSNFRATTKGRGSRQPSRYQFPSFLYHIPDSSSAALAECYGCVRDFYFASKFAGSYVSQDRPRFHKKDLRVTLTCPPLVHIFFFCDRLLLVSCRQRFPLYGHILTSLSFNLMSCSSPVSPLPCTVSVSLRSLDSPHLWDMFRTPPA